MSVDRNLPCPCGSGLKYKKCCLFKRQATSAPVEAGWLRMRRTEGEVVDRITALFHRAYGRVAFEQGWDEYTLWSGSPANRQEWPEFNTSFVPWLLFDWDPARTATSRPARTGTTPVVPGGFPAVSPARHYLDRRGAELDSYARRWLEEACAQPYTFCQVVSTEPGRLMKLRDLLLKRDVTVHERQASVELNPGQILYTKIVSLDGASVMLGCAPIALPGSRVDVILQARDLVLRRRGSPAELLRRHDVEFRQLYLDLRLEMPSLANTDGDPLQMTRLDFELRCTPQEAFDALLPLTGESDPEAFADTCTRDAAGALLTAEIPWLRTNPPGGPMPNTVLATCEMGAGCLTVQVNSQQRADAARAEIAARLGDRARFKGSVVESMEQMLAAARAQAGTPEALARESESEALQNLPEVRALTEKLMAEHWSIWPDIPLPALRGSTPREAARTAAGRERLEALLLDFEGHARQSGMPGPDLAALRRGLGLDRALAPPPRVSTAKRPTMLIADLRDTLPGPDWPAHARPPRLARHLQTIAEAASIMPAAEPVPTPISCRRRPDRKPCPGRLLAHQQAQTGEIHWHCPVCGDAGMIHHWQGTAHDFGGRPHLPQVTRITLATGFRRRPDDEARLESLVFAGAEVTDALRRAVLDNRITELSGEYGDPRVGSPAQVDRLEITHEGGVTRITIHNRALMLLHGDDEAMRRLHRMCGAVERAAGGG
jgi:hypothetical protein